MTRSLSVARGRPERAGRRKRGVVRRARTARPYAKWQSFTYLMARGART